MVMLLRGSTFRRSLMCLAVRVLLLAHSESGQGHDRALNARDELVLLSSMILYDLIMMILLLVRR